MKKGATTDSSDQEIIEKIKPLNSEEQGRIRKYTKGRFLGRGGFGECYELVCQDNNKVFAAKAIKKENLQQQKQKMKLLREIKIHKSLHHEQIVAFEHNFEDDKNQYILLELCENQTLNEVLKRRKTLTELEVQCYLIQLLKGLIYLRSHKILHRDLKLDNLFLTDKLQLKIGDFGLATKLDYLEEKRRTVCGTTNYLAPEVLKAEYYYEVDVWAVGVIIYQLITGKLPFNAKEKKIVEQNIMEVKYTFPDNAKISSTAKNLIKRILVKDRTKRPSYEEILMDDFFNQGSAIPKLIPVASLVTTPNLNYIKRYIPNVDKNGVSLLEIKEKEEEEIKEKNEKENKKESGENKEQKESDKKDNNSSTKEKSEETTKEETITNENKIIEKPEKDLIKGPDVFVLKWVDYSSKYGIGYLLNNKCIGVYFNDCTKLIYNPKTEKISFIERKVTTEKDMLYTFGLKEAPKELQKKIIIFQQFKKYFDEDKEKKEKEKESKSSPNKAKKKKSSEDKNPKPKEEEKEKKEETKGEIVFLRKWMKTSHAIIFRLSNKTIQVTFKDQTEIILFNDIVCYKDKNKNVRIYKIDEAFNSCNFEMNKRIKYVQNIFTKIINVNSQKNNNN